MLGGRNRASYLRRSRHFRNMCLVISHINAAGYIEIAIKKISVPRNTNKGSAHDFFYGARIEAR
jgi:hypothetical protein